MKAPTPNEILKLNNSQSIQIQYNDNLKYNLIISFNYKIKNFEIEDLISFPKNEYFYSKNFENLQKLNRFFLLFQDNSQIKEAIINSVNNKLLSIIKENDLCKIKIKNPFDENEVIIEIPKKIKNINQQIESIIPLIIEMKQKIENCETKIINLEKENKDLKQEISKLKNENKDLKQEISKLKNEGISKLENENKDLKSRIIKLEEINIKYIKNEPLFFQESKIINRKDEELIINWLPKKYKFTNLIFCTSRDGDTIDAFKNKCENQSPTLVIIKTDKGIIFGGYASSPWKEKGPIQDNNSFIFSIDLNKKYNVKNTFGALYGYYYQGSIMFQFGCCGFRICNNCTQNNNNYISNSDYEGISLDINKGIREFKVNELEIYKLN